MVSNVSNYAYTQDPMVYAQHLAVPQHQASLTDDLKSSLTAAVPFSIFSGIGAKNSFYATQELAKHKTTLKNIPSAFSNGVKGAFGNLTGGNFGTTFETAKNIAKNSDAVLAAREIQDMIKATVKSGDSAKLQELQKLSNDLMAAAAKSNNADEVAKLVNKADDIVKAAKGAPKTTGIIATIKKPFQAAGKAIKGSKAGQAVADGASKLATKFPNATAKLGKFAKFAKKGGIVFDLAIEGGLAMFTEIMPAFKNGGTKEGMKQVGKSAVQVGGSVAGFAGGAKAGASIGAAIGSIFPGAGTAIGGAIGGLIGGFLGSSLCSGIAKKITGKNYSEKAAEQEAKLAQDAQQVQQAQAQQVQTNPYGNYNFNVPTDLYPQVAYVA